MKRLWTLGILLVLLFPLAVAGAQDDTTTVAPPPTDYAEVADTYAELSDSTTALGVEIEALLINKDLETLYNRFSPTMQAAITLEQFEEGYDQITAAGAIGERSDFRILSASGYRVYKGLYAWGDDQEIMFNIFFNDAGEIEGLIPQPISELPEDPAADYQNTVTFRLPFDGLWYTYWGGPDVPHNYHVETPAQRHAYDFVIWKDGATFAGDGTANTDYYVYGQTILSPADGEIITLANDLPESLPQVETDTVNLLGNHVVIQVAEDAYLFICHMQPGSILVEVGDTVAAGQPIGLVGNSGNTSEPHIHIHLQDQPELVIYDDAGQPTGFTDAIGLPLQFSNYLANGEPVEIGVPIAEQFIQNAE
jgi:murein DD-endopeptidase MepM/ murein hydrolase activator NlpD